MSNFSELLFAKPSRSATTKLLLHFEGANGSSDFVDSSVYTRTITKQGSPTISTAWKAVGDSSGLFSTSNALSYEHSAELVYGTKDFEISFYVYMTSVSGFQMFLDNPSSRIYYGSNVFTVFSKSYAWTPSINTQYFAQIKRVSGTLRTYVNGSEIGTGQALGDVQNNGTYYIGAAYNLSQWLSGYLDEFKIDIY